MKLQLSNYKTLVFDCDGVILHSNKVKTEAFYLASLPYGVKAAEELVSYHIANGGISRYKKFKYFMSAIVPIYSKGFIEGPTLEELLDSYASKVRTGLLECNVAKGLDDLKKQLPGVPWLIVSGGDQDELREVFKKRNIDYLFDGGIFGSPDDKELILKREINNGNIIKPALFLGDSKYDYKASNSAELDFVFISGWSEVENAITWCASNKIKNYSRVDELNTMEV